MHHQTGSLWDVPRAMFSILNSPTGPCFKGLVSILVLLKGGGTTSRQRPSGRSLGHCGAHFWVISYSHNPSSISCFLTINWEVFPCHVHLPWHSTLAQAQKEWGQYIMVWSLQNFETTYTFSLYKSVTSGIFCNSRKLSNAPSFPQVV